jgi:Ca-activated chloride channel family protein
MGRFGGRPVTRRDLLALSGFALPLAAQTQKETPVFRADVRMVRLLVTVKDANGRLIGSLEKSDFSIADTGVPQDIAIFERHTEQPLSISLLIDTSASTAKDLKYEITSASRFLKALTREGNPQDSLSLYSFSHDVTLQANFTRNPGRIERALATLKADAGTSMYDVLCFAAEGIEDRDGRRVLVVVSDGGDTTSVRTYQEALRAAHRADAVVYGIVVVPITNDAGRNIGGEHALIALGQSTGGRVFFPAVGPDLDAAFDQILRDLRTQYLVAYYPKNLPESKGGFRPIRVELKRPELRAFTRGGYYEE